MSRLTRYLLTALLLLPSLAFAADPSTYAGAIAVLRKEPAKLWTGAVGGTNVAALNDTIQNAETDILSRVFTQGTAGNRPQWKENGWIFFGLSTANRWLTLPSSEAFFNSFHVNGSGGLLIAWQRSTANGSATEVIVANNNAASGQGFLLYNTSTEVYNFAIWVNGSSIVTLQLGTFADTDPHILEVRVRDGRVWARVDNRAPVEATHGALSNDGTDDASNPLTIGVRAGNNLPANANVRDLVILNQPATDADRIDWLSRNPLAPVDNTNDTTVLAIGDMEVVLRKFWSWTVEAVRYKSYPVLNGAAGLYQGTVISFDSVLHGSGHGGETVSLATVNGETLAPGLYAAAGVTQVKESTLGTTLALRSTTTYRENSWSETIRLERITPSDGKAISGSAAYVTLGTRTKAENLFAWYDAEGTVLPEWTDRNTSTPSTENDFNEIADETEILMPPGAVAAVQFDPVAGKGLLTILKDPGTLTPGLFLKPRVADNKFYGNMIGLTGAAAGAVFTTKWDFKVIEATSETWEDVAADAVARSFATGSGGGNKRLGLGIGIGLGSVERKSPAQRLAAAFNHEYTLAP